MHTEGTFSPETADEASERYEDLGATAQLVVKEVAKAMEFDAEEYEERVTGEVVETARDALFADRLEVTVGTRTEYEEWRDGADREVIEVGSDNVDNVVWHAPPFADAAVAATFQDEERAAVDTLRRQAFGRLYRDVV
ncbi:DUF5809 family protein [Halomicrobium salinisoli]|uniref:DUF5809 family protein n=1 Tax=Halomicrobium salinisoli TaxID=2878391 RepID=UPI001CF088C2|nr:DUF5809 family protein [Halomicrobium salinisoli]